MTRLGAALCLGLGALFLPGVALGWGNHKAHTRLFQVSWERIREEESLRLYLRNVLDLESSDGTPLMLTEGIDPFIDAEFDTLKRFEETGNRNHFGQPEEFPQNLQLRLGESFTPLQLMRTGTFAEDVRNPRARHHFHDPVNEHPPPAGSRGLDNLTLLGAVAEQQLAELITWVFRGGDTRLALRGILFSPVQAAFHTLGLHVEFGNFDLTGRSALDRALNRPSGGFLSSFPSDDTPVNLFALPNAERYLYRSVTGPTAEAREHYLALHFLAFGHVLHLLQDMTSPAHVRNDFKIEHGIGFLTNSLEKVGEEGSVPDFIDGLLTGNLQALEPRDRLAAFLALNPDPEINIGDYDATRVPLDAEAFDIADYWDNGFATGLAQVANRNFLSQGSIYFGDYPDPRVRFFTDGTPGSGTWAQALPTRNVRNGDLLDTGRRTLYLSSRLVPHLARYTYHARDLFGLLPAVGLTRAAVLSVWDESVIRDYVEILWPLAVEYSEKLMLQYFSPRIEVVPAPGNHFKLRNLNSLSFQFLAGAVEVYYDDVTDMREEVEIDCGDPDRQIDLAPAEEPGSLSEVSCSLTGPLSGAAPHNRGDFFVVVRGRLGRRGEAAAPSDFDAPIGATQFVTAFDHVRSQIVFDSVEGATLTDADDVDVFAVDIDPTQPLEEDAEPFERVNLTDVFRGLTGAPELDFLGPVAEPGGTRIALRSDLEAGPGGGFLDVRGDLDLFEFDPQVELVGLSDLLSLPHSRVAGRVPRPILRASWSLANDAVFYLDNQDDPGEQACQGRFPCPSLNRFGFAAEELETFVSEAALTASVADDVEDADLAVGDFRDRCAGIEQVSARGATRLAITSRCRRDEIVLDAQGENTRRLDEEGSTILLVDVVASQDSPGLLDAVPTHRFDLDGRRVASCDPDESCWTFSGSVFSPVWSPDGTQVAFLAEPPEDRTALDFGAVLYVADIGGSGSIREVVRSSEPNLFSPTWSPRGEWIAFGMQLEDMANVDGHVARDVFVTRPDASASDEPVRVTRDSKLARLLTWYKPELLLPGP